MLVAHNGQLYSGKKNKNISVTNNHDIPPPVCARTSLARCAAFSIRPAHVTVMEVTRRGVAASSVHAPAQADSASPCLFLPALSDDRSARSRLSNTAPAPPASPSAELKETRARERRDHLIVRKKKF